MSVYVLGVAMHPASRSERSLRLEEMVYRTSRAALADAGVTRRCVDSVTLGACDELDGRPISSMLLAAPAGGYQLDEIKVTDSGATALCLGVARVLAGESDLALVASWCKSSKTSVDAVMNFRGEPFFTRPFGITGTVANALFAQSVADEFGIPDEEITRRVVAAYDRAAPNDRGVRPTTPTAAQIEASEFEAIPLRAGHIAPATDGAVSIILASERFISRKADLQPLARVAGLGWTTDSYRLGKERLRKLASARAAWEAALRQAELGGAGDLDAVELETPTAYHEAAYQRVFGIEESTALSPSGGTFAQNPIFCAGLVGAAEAVLQVAGRAGAVQRYGVRRAAAHSCHGYAQQGNVVFVFDRAGSGR